MRVDWALEDLRYTVGIAVIAGTFLGLIMLSNISVVWREKAKHAHFLIFPKLNLHISVHLAGRENLF